MWAVVDKDTTNRRKMIMNLFNLNSDDITIEVADKDIEMKYPICFGKKYDKWLVSRCGKVWSMRYNKFITGRNIKNDKGEFKKSSKWKSERITFMLFLKEPDWWGDGSSSKHTSDGFWYRNITLHKMIIDTWSPLYDNPPKDIVWEEWEIVRKLPSVYNLISKTVCIDHIDDDPTNNHLDNLRRVTFWDNQYHRKAKGI